MEEQMNSKMTDEEMLAAKFSIIANAFVDTKNLSKNEFFSRVFDTVFLLIPEAQKGSFYELDGEMFKPIFGKGYDMELLKELSFSKDEAFIDYDSPLTQEIDAYQVNIGKRDDSLFSKRQIEIIKKLGTYSDYASLYAPINLDNVKIGLLCLENFDKKMFSETSRMVLKIFARLISNFYSFKVYQELESKRYKDIIDALVSAIEIKDVYTEGHAMRVSEISLKIAKFINIPSHRFRTIEIAAVLHDIGKIGTPTEILNKASALTEEEFEIIKRHPLDAKKILEKIQGFEEIAELTYRHHEYYNGSGYPEGLAGDQIPIEAQIIQAADALDAMTSKRAYREAMSMETAMSIFEKERGKQFHPEITDAILKLFGVRHR
jgi:polar amino acid transport system substrate-binding protein